MTADDLPGLPEPVDELCMEDGFNVLGAQFVYTADQMRAYGRECRATDPRIAALEEENAKQAERARVLEEALSRLAGQCERARLPGQTPSDAERAASAALSAREGGA